MRSERAQDSSSSYRRLTECRNGQCVRVVRVHLGRGALLNLHGLGMAAGDEIEVLRLAPLGGPVLVRVRGTEVAIGRALASQIEVLPL